MAETPLDRDPPFGQRPPCWTQTPKTDIPWTENPLDRHFWTETPHPACWTETPWDRDLPWKETPPNKDPLDRDQDPLLPVHRQTPVKT